MALIAQSDPEALESLKRRFPKNANLFDKGLELGVTTGLAEAYVELAQEGLKAAEQQTGMILDALASKLRWVKKLKLVSSLIAALSSLSLGSAVFAGNKVLQLCSAAVNFLAAAATVYGQYLEEPFSAKGIALTDLLERALKVDADVRQTKLALVEAGTDTTLQAVLVRHTAEIASEIRYISVFGGLRIQRS